MIRGFTLPHISLRPSLAVLALISVLSACSGEDSQFRLVSNNQRAGQDRDLPSLVVTNTPPPPGVLYRPGSRDTILANKAIASSRDSSGQIVGIPSLDAQHVETVVTHKAAELKHELELLRESMGTSSNQIKELRNKGESDTSSYYALIASINRDLQAGTTSGNPILIGRWNTAQDKLNLLSQSTGLLNTLATDLTYQASKASFLQESVRAAFSLSGAVDEDHKKLTEIEDGINQNIVAINRLMTQVNDEVNRRSVFMRTERANLQALSLAISKGELYGQSVVNSVYKRAADDGNLVGAGIVQNTASSSSSSLSPPAAMSGGQRRPLVVIRFDHPNVEYEQPLYTAISQALEKYPAVKFDLVAVSANEGNPARLAMASAEARKNGESVLRSLTQMGLPLERIRLNAATSKDVMNSEVHIYIR